MLFFLQRHCGAESLHVSRSFRETTRYLRDFCSENILLHNLTIGGRRQCSSLTLLGDQLLFSFFHHPGPFCSEGIETYLKSASYLISYLIIYT